MSFLKRRRTQRPADSLTTPANSDVPQSTTKDTPAPTPSTHSKRNITASALSLFTSKLTPRPHPNFPRRKSSRAHPISNTPCPSEWNHYGDADDSTSSREPSLEIRMPAGLGRRASNSTIASVPQTQCRPGVTPTQGRTRRKGRRSASMHASMASTGSFRAADLTDALLEAGEQRKEKELAPVERIPSELLATIFAFTDKADRLALACTAKVFVAPALRALYGELDLQEAKDAQLEDCIAILASKRHLAKLVRSFACGAIPSSNSSSSFSTLTFGIAFSNMHQLRSLVLPRFDTALLWHTNFRLRRFTLLQDDISAEEFRDMVSWLASQPAITHFALPNLVMSAIADYIATAAKESVNPEDPDAGDANRDCDPSSTRPLIPSHTLSRLTYLEASATVATALAPGRPLRSITVWVHNTLYDGLRPSALMSALTRSSVPLQKLTVKAASSKIDARTLERVLMAAGAELGDLEVLEVHWVLEDEVLYKHILHVLPRFRALRTLRFRRRLPPPPPSTPPPTCPPPASPSPTRPKTASRSGPPSPASTLSSRRRSTGTVVSLDMPLPRVHERAHLALWCKSCPSLRSVVFLSSAEWQVDCRRSVVAPTLLFIGLVD
ncbi:hypothetical protein CERSUDRAFT_95929 [Gelatoporia subvermispora B]|uniref:F-box domain-containing protein n=1 Tax=Ceriporiopsis subvermispora (strain B) TaxID=914234 RepID=M2QUE9_CERS8|nr:hypothetical protein CERSUDRAFT_95929 [Gelatoporia subvermispora B]